MNDASPPISIINQIHDECLCLAAQRAARLLARRFDQVFAPLGITNGQFSLMVALSGTWKPRLGELAQFLAMDSTTMTAAIKTLEKRGLVTLTPDEKDARARRPALTDQGRQVVVLAVPLWQAEHRAVQAGLPGQIARDLARALGPSAAEIGRGQPHPPRVSLRHHDLATRGCLAQERQ